MSQLKKDTQLTLMSRIPVMCLSFLTIVFLTRLLGPEGNGVYTFTLAVLNLLIAVLGFQLDGALPVFLARHKDHIPQILSSTFVLVLLSFIICTSVLSAVVFLIPVGRSLVIPENQPVLPVRAVQGVRRRKFCAVRYETAVETGQRAPVGRRKSDARRPVMRLLRLSLLLSCV